MTQPSLAREKIRPRRGEAHKSIIIVIVDSLEWSYAERGRLLIRFSSTAFSSFTYRFSFPRPQAKKKEDSKMRKIYLQMLLETNRESLRHVGGLITDSQATKWYTFQHFPHSFSREKTEKLRFR